MNNSYFSMYEYLSMQYLGMYYIHMKQIKVLAQNINVFRVHFSILLRTLVITYIFCMCALKFTFDIITLLLKID